jgi:mannose-6-phosphate isomerase class I
LSLLAACTRTWHGMAVEIMASSDNVLRAGLTPKHIDVAELLRTVDYVATPPIRIAPEVFHGATRVFYAPVDDFELSITTIDDDLVHPMPGRGPRILLCLDGGLTIESVEANMALGKGIPCLRRPRTVGSQLVGMARWFRPTFRSQPRALASEKSHPWEDR